MLARFNDLSDGTLRFGGCLFGVVVSSGIIGRGGLRGSRGAIEGIRVSH